MLNSVNINNINNYPANRADNQARPKTQYAKKNVSFGYQGGYQGEYQSHPIRDTFLNITNDIVGLFGVNAALWWIQDVVNTENVTKLQK